MDSVAEQVRALALDERVEAALAATHALIDLDALAGNVAAARDLLPSDMALTAVLKANAYGHGLVPCGRAAVAAGASELAVARIEEGLALREAGIEAPILVLGPANPGRVAQAAAAGLMLAVGSQAGLAAILEQLGDAPQLHVQLKIDSGMHRFGVDPEEAVDLARAIQAEGRLSLEGIFTHYASADVEGDNFTEEQIRRFSEARRALAAAGIDPPRVHLANSAGVLRGLTAAQEAGANGARVGIALYGIEPSPAVPLPAGFRPVMTLRSRLAGVFDLAAGESISYAQTYVAEEAGRCATVPIGYADGLPWGLSNRGWAVVDGVVCPIRGRVCMDQVVVDTGDVPHATAGDLAVLLGGADGAMTAEQMAAASGTIAHQVVSGISARVPRIYLRGGQPVAVSDLLGYLETS